MNLLKRPAIPITHEEFKLIGNIVLELQGYQNIINSEHFSNLPIEAQQFYSQKYLENFILNISCLPKFLERYIKDYPIEQINNFLLDGINDLLYYDIYETR